MSHFEIIVKTNINKQKKSKKKLQLEKWKAIIKSRKPLHLFHIP
jgi:hypothetical protein